MGRDAKTAAAFATSWNTLPEGSVYTAEQFEGWLDPLGRADVEGRDVLELGCGNASLMVHMARWQPQSLEGIDLGASVISARRNMNATGFARWQVTQGDLTDHAGPGARIESAFPAVTAP